MSKGIQYMHRNPRPFLALAAGIAVLSCASVQPALAQGTPWISEPETGSVSVTFANQRATEFFRADTATKGPLAATDAHLSQSTLWFGVNYAFTDAVAIDIQSAWARSFLPGPVGPTPEESFSGLGDSNIAVTWRIVDEYVSDAPSVAIRGALIAAGNYETGYINSLGDGGHGFEGSVIAGKFWQHAGFSAELGYRFRGSTEINEMAVGGTMGDVDIPADVFFNLSAFVPVNDVLTLGVDYQMVNATDGIDIGGPGFSPSRFPALEEDIHLIGGRLLANVTDVISLNVFGGQVVAGRNTAKSRVIGVGATFAFGGGGLGL
ncbi:MAG: hypothetical protein OXF27_11035 [Acidobacteria bacterium]|nr:hypothetical protein [Acidobacteriota bacterium]